MKRLIGGLAILLTSGLAGCSQDVPFSAGTPVVVFDVQQCPPTLGRGQDVSPDGAPLDRLMPEQPRPEMALLCRYTSSYGPHATSDPTLADDIRLDRRGAARLAAAVARVRVGIPAGSSGCPDDTGSVTLIGFAYAHRPPVRIWWHASGCRYLDNGATAAVEVANDSFFHLQHVLIAAERTQG